VKTIEVLWKFWVYFEGLVFRYLNLIFITLSKTSI